MSRIILSGYCSNRSLADYLEAEYGHDEGFWTPIIQRFLQQYPKFGTLESTIKRIRDGEMHHANIQLYLNGVRQGIGNLLVSDTIANNACIAACIFSSDKLNMEKKEEVYDKIKDFLDILGYVDVNFL